MRFRRNRVCGMKRRAQKSKLCNRNLILIGAGTTRVAVHFITVTTETPLPSKRW
jgi:hypothetical protein